VNRALLPLAGFALLAVVLGIGVHRSPDKGTIASPLIGRAAPSFALPSLTDASRMVSPADWRGRWWLLNVWGTWCPGCREEHQMLLDIQKSGRIPIVGFNWKDDDAQALAWLSQLGNPYERVAVDHTGQAAIDWGVYGAPETFLIDPAGRVVYKHVGPLTRAEWEHDILPRLPASSARTGSP
jgi:cytochrome c biogenesis protein CcmG, thiol:disulfide interchange protein DsbE